MTSAVLLREIRRERHLFTMRAVGGFLLAALVGMALRSLRSIINPDVLWLLVIACAAVAYGFGYAIGGTLNRIGASDHAEVRPFVLSLLNFERTGDSTNLFVGLVQADDWLALLANQSQNRRVAKLAQRAMGVRRTASVPRN